MPRSAIMITKSLRLNLKLVYQLTHRTMICPSKCRPLNSASTGPKGCILPSSATGSVCTRTNRSGEDDRRPARIRGVHDTEEKQARLIRPITARYMHAKEIAAYE